MGGASVFRDRADAGRRLALCLGEYTGRPGVLVLGLAPGGVPVAFEVAQALELPLDVLLVSKLGAPGREQPALGAIASGGVRVLDEEVVRALELPEQTIASVTVEEQRELERRERLYRDGGDPLPVGGRTVILIDDGLASGGSMRAAALALRERGVGELVVAAPVAQPETWSSFERQVDRSVCAHTAQLSQAVGDWYQDLSKPDDEQVRELLRRAAELYAHNSSLETHLRGVLDI